MEEFVRKTVHELGKLPMVVIQTRHEFLCEKFGVSKKTPEDVVLKMWDDLQHEGEEEIHRKIEINEAQVRLDAINTEDIEAQLADNPTQETLVNILKDFNQVLKDMQTLRRQQS